MVLISLIEKYFFKNLETITFPSHVIQVTKQNLLKCESITFYQQVKGVDLTCSKADLSSLKYLCKLFENIVLSFLLDNLYYVYFRYFKL